MNIYNLTGYNVYFLNQKNELVMSCSMVQPFKGNLENHGKMKRLKAFLATLPAYTRVIIAQEHADRLAEATKHLKVWSIPESSKVQLWNQSFIYRVKMKG